MQEKHDLFWCVVLVPNSHSGESGNVSGMFVVIEWSAVGGNGGRVIEKLVSHGLILKVWNYNVVECGGDVKGKIGIKTYLYLKVPWW